MFFKSLLNRILSFTNINLTVYIVFNNINFISLANCWFKPLTHTRKIILAPNQTPDRNEHIYQGLKF